ncbi:MAG: radical SAM protein [Candidatus Asgardarchaeia archaeon]
MTENKTFALKQQCNMLLNSVKSQVFPRRGDNLLIVGANRVYRASKSFLEFLEPFWVISDFEVALNLVKKKFSLSEEAVLRKLCDYLQDLIHLAKNELNLVKVASVKPFNSLTTKLQYPILAEIALTDRCNNRCVFCFWGVGEKRKGPFKELSTDDVKKLIRKIWYQARAPNLHFTGGEPTLREDLPELISYGRKTGFRVILLTNGRRLSDEKLAKKIVESGIKGIQISLEADNANLHDRIVGVKGAFEETVQGIQNLLSMPGVFKDFWVHTNTTINRWNIDNVIELPYFLKELGLKSFSMNMVIWSGNAVNHTEVGVSYFEIGDVIKEIKKRAEEVNLRFDWYSPLPMCIFNTAIEGFGIKGCAAANGLLSVDAQGYVLPCSSFPPEYRIGNLLEEDFEKIWFSEEALKWRNKTHEFLPDACKTCRDFDVCGGACPLYWMNNPNRKEDLKLMHILRPAISRFGKGGDNNE